MPPIRILVGIALLVLGRELYPLRSSPRLLSILNLPGKEKEDGC